MRKIKVMTVFGTRPEAIKMAPLVKELQSREEIEQITCVTAQHRQMLDQVLETFQIKPEYDLDIMKQGQTLNDVVQRVLGSISEVLEKEKPDIVLVHGDTVEAGLRTWNKYSPYPEEMNRQMVGCLADMHFSPTEVSAQNLLNEGKDKSKIYITGNTAIDAMATTVDENYQHPIFEWVGDNRMILLTAHRRENLGEPMYHIFRAIKRLVYPIHLNPRVRQVANDVFQDCDKVRLIEPLEVFDFHNFQNKSYLIMTDSGGIQEEAPSLGKPVLVLRDTTERPEGIKAGTLKQVRMKKSFIKRQRNY